MIRPAELRDAAEIAQLSRELGYPAVSGETERLEILLELAGHAVFVAEGAGGDLAGWVHVFAAYRLASPSFGELGGLVVTERLRGQGIGRALVEAAEMWARAQGLAKLRVRSNAVREGAHGFYSHLGFAKVKNQAVFQRSLNEESHPP